MYNVILYYNMKFSYPKSPIFASAIEQFAIIVGIISVGLILCLTILNVSIIQCIFLFLFFLLIIWVRFIFTLLIINKLFALVAAILFPVAIVTQFRNIKLNRFSERLFWLFLYLKIIMCLFNWIYFYYWSTIRY